MEDKSIVQLYWQRDQEAIKLSGLKYGRQCRGIARDILRNEEDSEECVNDTYWAAWNSIPPQRPVYLGSYLFRIVRNISLNRLKARRSQKHGGGELTAVLDELDACLPGGVDAEKAYELKELEDAINDFLLSLPENDRVIFAARYWLLLPGKVIARRTGFSESRINTSLHRTRNKLRSYLTREDLL